MLFGDRIIFERKRLGLTQAQAAEICGITRGMWLRYEKNTASMGSDILARFVEAGADVNYIITGAHTPPPKELTPRESALLDNYRHSPEEGKRSAEESVALFAKLGPGDKTGKKAG